MRGVLVCAYGSPSGVDDVERYYTCILGGRAPPEQLLKELSGRYQAIGGASPLPDITRRQAYALQHVLEERGNAARVHIGMKYSAPFIPEVVDEIAASGISDLLVLPLTPFSSSVGKESYLRIATEAAEAKGLGINMTAPEEWHLNPHFIDCWTELMQEQLDSSHADHVIFTAHSIPQRYIDAGEPYLREITEVAEALSGRLGLREYEIAFQSAGRTREAWLGPSLEKRLEELGRERRRSVLAVPVGFVSEHLEVLYDIDVEARRLAEKEGIRLERTSLPNDRPLFISALADLCSAG